MKKIVVTISSRDYTINLDEDFARIFQKTLASYQKQSGSLDIKDLLFAFVEQSYQLYKTDKTLCKLSEKINENLH